MNTFACASPEIQSVPERTLALNPAQGYARQLSGSHQTGYEGDELADSLEGQIQAGTFSGDLELLVADIASLARSHLNLGRTLTASTRPKRIRPPLHESWTNHHCDEPTVCGKSDVHDEELLNAVHLLLESALERMLSSSSGRSGDQRRPTVPYCPRGGIAPSALRRVREHIDKNLAEHIEISDLAMLTGLSPCHFARAFKQSTGMPPHRYLTSRRVQEAARLIESTDKPLFEIALDVGFSDQSHFTRVFSAQIGESPSRFRHQRR